MSDADEIKFNWGIHILKAKTALMLPKGRFDVPIIVISARDLVEGPEGTVERIIEHTLPLDEARRLGKWLTKRTRPTLIQRARAILQFKFDI